MTTPVTQVYLINSCLDFYLDQNHYAILPQ